MEGNGIWGLVGTVAIAYVVYRLVNRDKKRKFGVLQGGKTEGQFSTTSSGPPSGFQGNVPQIAVLGWPNMGACKC